MSRRVKQLAWFAAFWLLGVASSDIGCDDHQVSSGLNGRNFIGTFALRKS